MTIEEGLYSWLTGNADISALCGDRVYPDKLPQEPTYPAMTYQRITTGLPMAHDGPLDLENARFQFNCLGLTPKAARTLANTLKQELAGFRGTMGDVSVHGAFLLNQISDFEDEAEVYRAIVDFRINYKI